MATLLLTAAASAAANAAGLGTVGKALLMGAAAIGGRLIDGMLLGGGRGQHTEGPRLDVLEATSSTEGNPVKRAYGRVRLGAELIWAATFEERATTESQGGKGGGPKISQTTYSYYGTFAVALCEGEIAYVNRIWADGKEMDLSEVTWRLYRGTETQTPDPAIEAIEGEGKAPAYRGIAYVVFEDLPLDPYGRRIPQLNFEVFRLPPSPTVEPLIRGVDLIPGSTEFGYDPEIVSRDINSTGGTKKRELVENAHLRNGQSNWTTSMEHLEVMLPNVESVVFVCAWFGNDLRCATCTIKPRVDLAEKVTTPHVWEVAGLTRETADVVSTIDGRAAYGGSPNDASVVRAIQDLKTRGYHVIILPFIMVDVPADNTLPNPYSDNAATTGQAAYPWRGRITPSPAPGFAGSPDTTSAAETQVTAFLGAADPAHVTSSGTAVTWTGASATDWGYRKFILHHAHLAKLGGADAFLVGSEMVAMTTARSAAATFPFVDGLITLLGECRTILGSGVEIGYAADWSEYHSHRPADGSGDVYFHLDPLWMDEDCDFIGIDNYLPLADWRDGTEHLDYDPAAGHTSIYSVDYLRSNIEGGEYYDWFYASDADRRTQTRSTIADTLYGTPWVFRNKDLRNWWREPHHDRPGGARTGILPNGHNPRAWSLFAGAVVADEPGTFLGIFKSARRVARGTSSITGIADVSFPTTNGEIIEIRAFFAAGSSGRGMVYLVHDTFAFRIAGALGALAVVGSPAPHTLLEVVNVNHGGGVYEARMTVQISGDDSTTFVRLGPNAGAADLDVIVLGCEVIRRGQSSTAWVPQAKPFWFIEIGCPSVDKGPNQPNVFVDAKSSESQVPHFSSGARDDVVQRAFLKAWIGWIEDDAENPVSTVYGDRMVARDRVHVWSWDARPFPSFPLDERAWGDAPNWRLGHWLSARVGTVYVPDLLAHLAADYGFEDGEFSEAYGTVDGYVIDRTMSLRDAWGPLELVCFFDLVETGDKIVARTRHSVPSRKVLADATLLHGGDRGPVTAVRAQESEMPKEARIRYLDSERAYQPGAVAAEWLSSRSDAVSEAQVAVAMDQTRMQSVVDTWLADVLASRERLSFGLMPSDLALEPGDIVEVPLGGVTYRVRIVEIADTYGRACQASTFLDTVIRAATAENRPAPPVPERRPTMAPLVVVVDLPLLNEDDNPAAAYVAAHADPWPGAVAVYRSPQTTGYSLNTLLPVRAVIGETLTDLYSGPTGVYDRANIVRIEIYSGELASVDRIRQLEGENAFAIQNAAGDWEIVLARTVTLVSPKVYDLSILLRGLRGTEHAMRDPVAAGARVVWLDGGGVAQLAMTTTDLKRPLNYRSGPADKPIGHTSFITQTMKLGGEGLEPYAPVHVRASKDFVTGDVTISWVRRTRIGGDPWPDDEDDVPLAETSERYRVRIRTTDLDLIRTFNVTEPTVTWTAAQQTADLGGPATTFVVDVFQRSDLVGSGARRRVTLVV